MDKKYRIGVDLGGTNVKIAIVDEKGHIAYSSSEPTRAEMGYKYTIQNIINLIKTSLKETDISKDAIGGIGVGCPGQIDSENGIVRLLPNIPGWVNVPLTDIMEEEFGIKTCVDNDVRCATLGEMAFGAGKGLKNIICITVGTGIGSGIVVNGKLARGASGTAGEIGHMMLQDHMGPICGCGNTGCLEALASGPTIVQMANEYLMSGKSTKFRELAVNTPISPRIVAEAAEMGDQVAKRIFEINGYWIGIGMANLVNILNPEAIIVGGGVAQAGDLLLEPIRKVIKERALSIPGEAVKVVAAELGESAGIIGASLLTLQ
ncbi:MAG: ROK family protein [bacterium]